MTEYNNPVKIEFGKDSIRFLPRFLGNRKALLITSSGFSNRGIVEKLMNNNPGIIEVIDCIKSNPTVMQLEEIRSSIQHVKFDVIVALGGGSVIDSAKAIAPYSEGVDLNLLDLLKNGLPSNASVIPIIAIPTTAGTGSEVTMWGTVWDDINKKKYSIADKRLYCEVAILDASLHVTLPKEITIQTGLDALSHSLESIWNKNSNEITVIYAERAINMIVDTLPKLVSDLSNIELRERMLLASYYAGLAFSHTQTAIAHAMSYYMTLHKNIPHGIAASITLPIIIETYYEQEMKNKNLIVSNQLKEKLISLFNVLDINLSLKSYNLVENDIEMIFEELGTNIRAQNSNINNALLYKNLLFNIERS